MYSIDTILNFLADYGSYYLYELNKLEETSADEDIEKIRKKIEQIDKEYDILERLIYDTGEKYIIEKEEGKIKDISLAEKEKAFLPPKVCSSEDMEEISKWIRYSYYIFVENYRNKLTSLKAGKSTYNFEISEENICHLLGIEKRNLEHILKERNITIFKILQMLMNDGEKINGETPLEVITRIQKENPIFNYEKIKYKNFLFQNFGILSEMSAICTNARPKANNNWGADTFLLNRLSKKCGRDNYAQMGFFNSDNVKRLYKPETLQSTNDITNGIGDVYNIRSIFKQAKGTTKEIREKKTNNSKLELCCIFSAKEQLRMIEKILEEGGESLSIQNITELKVYYYRIYSSVSKFNKVREVLKEKTINNGYGKTR